MVRIKYFLILCGVVFLSLCAIVIDTTVEGKENATYATGLIGIFYTTDTLHFRYGGLNGYFSGHYQYPGAYVMQNESFIYSIKEKMR